LKQALRDKIALVHVVKKADELKGFHADAHWRELIAKQRIISEPLNTFKSCAPTVPEEDSGSVPMKHNSSEKFDCSFFDRKKLVPIQLKNGKIKYKDGNIIRESVIRSSRCPRRCWLIKLNFTTISHTLEFFEAFLPVNEKLYLNAKS
jgi:hypothetical protein